MARPLRVEYPGAFYHVVHHGDAGKPIFQAPEDGSRFLSLMGTAVERFAIHVHGFCLIPNCYHIIVETPEANLSQAIQWLNVSYAIYFNREHKTSGPLFQGRFKSVLFEPDEYLKPLTRYIHWKPVQADLAQRPLDYRWSSFPALAGKAEAPQWLEANLLLSKFGKTKETAINRFRSYVENADPVVLGNLGKEIVAGFILGSPGFVERIKNGIPAQHLTGTEMARPQKARSAIRVEHVIVATCRVYGSTEKAIVEKGKKRNLPRDMAIYLSRVLTGETGVRLGKAFGNISGAAITSRCNAISKEMEGNPKLREQMRELKETLIGVRS